MLQFQRSKQRKAVLVGQMIEGSRWGLDRKKPSLGSQSAKTQKRGEESFSWQWIRHCAGNWRQKARPGSWPCCEKGTFLEVPGKTGRYEAQALLVGLADEMDVAHAADTRGKQWKQSVLGLGTDPFMTAKLDLQT